jgi:6-pyruvoyltetrahydropterin/6-carboxytetrahydropterin synthase
MPKVKITRRVHFSAAHRLHNPALSDEENRRIFGLCNSPNWHGHNYELDVTVEGEVDPTTGYVVDLKELRDTAEEVIGDLDHRNLNLDVPWLEGTLPSTENLVVAIWNRLAPRVPRGRLVRLVLWETPRNYAEYTGELVEHG